MTAEGSKRLIITMREPYDKSFYSFSKQDLARLAQGDEGLGSFFIVEWDEDRGDVWRHLPEGLRVDHESGYDLYPWTAIQEIDVFVRGENE